MLESQHHSLSGRNACLSWSCIVDRIESDKGGSSQYKKCTETIVHVGRWATRSVLSVFYLKFTIGTPTGGGIRGFEPISVTEKLTDMLPWIRIKISQGLFLPMCVQLQVSQHHPLFTCMFEFVVSRTESGGDAHAISNEKTRKSTATLSQTCKTFSGPTFANSKMSV